MKPLNLIKVGDVIRFAYDRHPDGLLAGKVVRFEMQAGEMHVFWSVGGWPVKHCRKVSDETNQHMSR